MQTKIFLVRHAEAEVNINPLTQTKDDTLTDKGMKQAQQVANSFINKSIAAIYTSKIHRARLTAAEISQALDIAPVIIESLKERRVIWTSPKEYEYTESFESLKTRLMETRNFLENLPVGEVIVVSHALYLRALFAFLTFGELLTEELLQKITDNLLVGNAAVSILTFSKEKGRWHIESWNDESHLS